MSNVEKLKYTFQNFIELVEIPEKNCSCHISPPCYDCVEYGALREAYQEAKESMFLLDLVKDI